MIKRFTGQIGKLLTLILVIFSLPASAVNLPESGVTGYVAEDDGFVSQSEAVATIANGAGQSPWDLERIDARQAWQVTTGAKDVLIAVLDTGIASDHETLKDKIVADINFTPSTTVSDRFGHGTHVAGIIAARPGISADITGLAYGASLLNVKVANDDGSVDAGTLAQGIIWAVDNGAGVINISLTISKPSPALEEAINYAWEKGHLIVAAAGNNFNTKPVYPAAYRNVIAVAATDNSGQLMSSSNRGDWVDVTAPGSNIYSALPGNGFAYKSGTSMATALVSGEAALLYTIASDTNGDGKINDEVRAALEGGTELAISGMGKGQINVYQAIKLLSASREGSIANNPPVKP